MVGPLLHRVSDGGLLATGKIRVGVLRNGLEHKFPGFLRKVISSPKEGDVGLG